MASTTLRRDVLRRLCEAGRLVMVEGYHFDDMHGESRTHKRLPVELIPKDRSTCREGICYVFPSDFDSGSGHASKQVLPDGRVLVTLYVHSNSNYTFEVLPK